MRTLVIGGIEIPIRASEQLSQEYEPVQSRSRLRMSDGTLIQQTAWSGKLSTSIRASGISPAGLEGLDYDSPITIKCIKERVIASASNVIDVPAARRSDYGVEGRAVVGNKLVSTAVTMSTDEATLTTVAGATSYQAIYWPEISCWCDPPSESGQVRQANHTWDFEGQQV